MKNENKNTQNFCTETESMIDEYLEGMISVNDKTVMDEHLAGCEECSNYLKETQTLIKDLNAMQTTSKVLSAKEKDELWKKVSSDIDINKHVNEKKTAPDETASESRGFFHKFRYVLSGAAAVLVFGFVVYGLLNMKFNTDRLSQQSVFGLDNYWKVSLIGGNPKIGEIAMGSNDSIKEGQWIQTDTNSRAELLIANIGKVIIEPNSKVIFVKGEEGDKRILVEYGTINTEMNPNSKTFSVELPSAVTKDNGGSYTMTVDSNGDGLVFVRTGKVEIDSPNRDAIVPAGSLVLTKKNLGVGTPFNDNSSPKFKHALYSYDFGDCSGSCVATLLNNATVTDAVTLVNLIPTIENQYKDRVYTKLANFVAPPRAISRDSIPYIDEDEIEKWVDKIQAEVQKNIEENMKNVEENMKNIEKNLENMKHFEVEMENFGKDWEFKYENYPHANMKFDTVYFDKEEFKKNMEEMKKQLKEDAYFDNEQFKEDMEDLKEDLKDLKEDLKENQNLNKEELRRELEKANDEIRRAVEEVNKINIGDSIANKVKIHIKPPEIKDDKDIDDVEAPKEIDTDDNEGD